MGEVGAKNPSGCNPEIRKGGVELDEAQLRPLAETYAAAVYDDFPVEEAGQWKSRALERLRELTSQSETSLVFDGDKLIAAGGHKFHGNTKEGKPVVELTMAIVSPEYQGRNLTPMIYAENIRTIQEQSPNAILSVVSKNPAVHHMATKYGFTELPLVDYYQMTENDPRLPDEEMMRENGFKAFIFDIGKVGDEQVGTQSSVKTTLPGVLS